MSASTPFYSTYAREFSGLAAKAENKSLVSSVAGFMLRSNGSEPFTVDIFCLHKDLTEDQAKETLRVLVARGFLTCDNGVYEFTMFSLKKFGYESGGTVGAGR